MQHSPLSIFFLATILSGIIIFLERLFPFALFSKKDPPPIIRFIEKYIPSLIIAILIVYTLKDVQFSTYPYGAPYFIAMLIAVFLHLFVKNSMVSVFGSTIVYMILLHTLN